MFVFHENTQTKKLQEECEAKHISEQTCPRCEDGWEPHGGKLYFFSSFTLSWNESRRQCKSMGGDLVVVNSREEQRFLQTTVREKMDKAENEFWIGQTDSKKEGEWLWVDDTRLNASLTFWHEGEPNNWNENCVTMWEKDGAMELKTWYDQSCKSSHEYICEKPERN
ncbi:C-type lectin domain family 4 member E-like [Platichthys flesus]|uniref:C-type lectin domain family 4 member E-like n=1 Tax=Platichthys flesus TaxID=8260 RepID=UPI002DBA8FB0|nr:C-type lectin domain family 4 member E-like [Platichthys flesus]